jgi:hypothetical protein
MAGDERRGDAIEDPTHLPEQGVGAEWLLKKEDFLFQDTMAHDRVIGVPGEIEYFESRLTDPELFGELPATHPRHHYVCHQQIQPPFASLGHLEGGTMEAELTARIARLAAWLVVRVANTEKRPRWDEEARRSIQMQ